MRLIIASALWHTHRVRGMRRLVVLLIVMLVVLFWWWRQRTPEPAAAPAVVVAPAVNDAERRVPAGCDPLPVPPPLPATLTPSAPTVEAVVQALDASLTDAHKAFLRCFPNEDDLVARVHGGLGRWLRNSLHLFSDNPLTASLRTAGVTSADQMSAVILRAYARSLRGQPLDIPTAVARTKAPVEAPEQK